MSLKKGWSINEEGPISLPEQSQKSKTHLSEMSFPKHETRDVTGNNSLLLRKLGRRDKNYFFYDGIRSWRETCKNH